MKDLMNFLDRSTVCFYTVKNLETLLKENGFEELSLREPFHLEEGGKYYVSLGASLYAFVLPASLSTVKAPYFRMIGAHTDSPCLRIKPDAEIVQNGYVKLNAEIYGGPIYSTWLDRPLSLAGRVTLKSDNVFEPRVRYIDFKRPVLTIPNLAIHMNRDVNNGVALNAQVDMLPVCSMTSDDSAIEGHYLKSQIAEQLSVSGETVAADEILDYDLFTYPTEKAELVGFNEEFLSSPRLDDLSMLYSAARALVNAVPSTGVNVLAAFNHEEIGSRSRTGAGSDMFLYVLEKIAASLGHDHEEFISLLLDSFLISADVAHAIHPAHPEKHDPVLKTKLGGGPVIKLSAGQRYITESEDYSVYEQICRKAGVPVQKFTNRSDAVGGSTIGPITAGHLPCRIVDMGIPILAMHSARELMAVRDFDYTVKSFETFYNE